MRYPAAEKLEILRLVEQSSLSVRRTLGQLGIPRSTFYCWYDRYRARHAEGLDDRTPAPRRVWNKLPAAVTQAVLELALKEPELSPRELAVSFVDQQRWYFVSEASVYRLLKAHDLITSPAFILMKAAESFTHPTTAPNQLWQTDFTYLRVIGWGWFYLSTVLDDFSRYILAWKPCTTMTATDVSDTLAMALRRSGLERVRVRHRPRLSSNSAWPSSSITTTCGVTTKASTTCPPPTSTSVAVRPFSIGGPRSGSRPSSNVAGCTTQLQPQPQPRWARSSLKSIANLSNRFGRRTLLRVFAARCRLAFSR